MGNFIELLSPFLKNAAASGQIKKLPIIMIETGTCTGDSISLDNIWTPTFLDILTNICDWRYDWNLMQSHGSQSYQVLMDTYTKLAGEYILIVQGAIVHRDGGNYNHVAYDNGKLITGLDMVTKLGQNARYVVAIGSCASFGGPAAAYPNPAECTGVQKVLPKRRVINVSGCPAHPDWTMGTLVHLALYGEPDLDSFGRPKMFYGETIHNNCPRRRYYDQGIFAADFGQKECLFRVGCKGPVTFADCPIRRWNDRYNWPIGCNSPCIGCTEPGFPDLMEPFHDHLQDIPFSTGTKVNTDKIGLGVLAVTTAAIIGHAGVSLYNGRMQKNLIDSSLKVNTPIAVDKAKKKNKYRLKKPDDTGKE